MKKGVNIMELKTDYANAKKAVNELIEKSKKLYDINALELYQAKSKANDWYQEVISATKEIFYDSEKIIKNMNKILIKEGRPSQGYALKQTFNIQTIDLEYQKDILVNKIKKIAQLLEEKITKP